MAERPAGQSAFDDGGGADVASRGPLGAGGNNQFTADIKRITELNTAITTLNTNIGKFKDHLPKIVEMTGKWATNMERLTKSMNGMGGGGGGGGKYIKDAGDLTTQVAGGGGGGGGFGGFTFISTDRSQNLTVNGYGTPGGGGGGGGGGGPRPPRPQPNRDPAQITIENVTWTPDCFLDGTAPTPEPVIF